RPVRPVRANERDQDALERALGTKHRPLEGEGVRDEDRRRAPGGDLLGDARASPAIEPLSPVARHENERGPHLVRDLEDRIRRLALDDVEEQPPPEVEPTALELAARMLDVGSRRGADEVDARPTDPEVDASPDESAKERDDPDVEGRPREG